jgi:hypothetical protein
MPAGRACEVIIFIFSGFQLNMENPKIICHHAGFIRKRHPWKKVIFRLSQRSDVWSPA